MVPQLLKIIFHWGVINVYNVKSLETLPKRSIAHCVYKVWHPISCDQLIQWPCFINFYAPKVLIYETPNFRLPKIFDARTSGGKFSKNAAFSEGWWYSFLPCWSDRMLQLCYLIYETTRFSLGLLAKLFG